MTVNKAVLKTLAWVMVVCLGALFSCKKEPVPSPDVTILQPSQNSSYAYGDTIFVKAEIYHEDLQRVNLTLVDANFSAVESPIQLPVSGTNASVNAYVVVTNKNLVSGQHHIRLQVIAGGESFNSFQKVLVTGIQRALRTTYVATSDSMTRQLHRIENGQSILSQEIIGDYSGLATNSFYDGVYMAPNYIGDLKLYKPLNDSLIWTDANNASNGAAFMTGLFNSNDAVYGFYQNGQVVRFGNNGPKQQIFQLPSGYRAIDAQLVDDRLLVMVENPPALGKELYYFSASTAAFLTSVPLPEIGVHIDVLPYKQDAVAVFFNNRQGEGKLRVYSKNGSEINVQALPNMVLKSAVAVGSDKFVLGTDQETVLFQTGSTGLTTLSPIPAQVLAFEDLYSDLYIGAGSSIWVYQFPSMNLKATLSYPQPLKAISFLYNK